MVKFKGRLSFKQYMPNKPIKWGVKVWALCESTSGYCLGWYPYTGKQNVTGLGLGYDVIDALTQNFHAYGHHLFYDNFYSSPFLSLQMMDHDIATCGTIRSDRIGYPRNFTDIPLARGAAPLFKKSGNLMACTWQDNKRVNVLSTIHGIGVNVNQVRDRKDATGFRQVHKPVCISEYNKYMGGVDLMDQLLQYYEFPHWSHKWYTPIYHRIREVAVVNGFILYKKVNPQGKMTHLKFRQGVIDGLVQGLASTRKRRGRQSLAADRDLRLTERHFGWTPTKNYKPDCSVCCDRKIKRVQTSDGCKNCNKPMCWPECFEVYHTVQDYRRVGRTISQRKYDARDAARNQQ
ncbi:piggyBac transposable element-derived protein 4-like [Lineus longissimus]|uniref:piggyBac transposable element-derived protein 4-like n=1 Tax=Lineus longissimus TaxID=88925 RepID=UPI00315C6154